MAGKRLIHKNVCTSKKIAALTWFEEVLYYRILINADDHGMFFSTAGSVLEMCFPIRKAARKTAFPSIKSTELGIKKLISVGLMEFKTINERRVLHVKDWNKYQYLRSDRAKHSFFGMSDGIPSGKPMVIPEVKVKGKVKGKDSKAVGKQPPLVHEFIKAWGETWSVVVGEGKKYPCNFGKEGKLVKDLLKVYEYDDLKKLAEAFFKSDDDFIRKSGYTIGVFRSMIPKLIAGNKSLTKAGKTIDAAKEHLRRIQNNDTRKLR